MTTKARDRRRAPRTPVMMAVGYEADVDRGDAQTVDVSETGLFLGTPNPLPVGTVLLIQLDEVSLQVQVRRVVEGGAGQNAQAGMGVRIVEADDDARTALRKYLRGPERRVVSVRVDGPWAEAVPEPVWSEPTSDAAADDGNGDGEAEAPEQSDNPGNPEPEPPRRGRKRHRRR